MWDTWERAAGAGQVWDGYHSYTQWNLTLLVLILRLGRSAISAREAIHLYYVRQFRDVEVYGGSAFGATTTPRYHLGMADIEAD